eukprot:CAMPEP_0113679522 /NCGR_PEP_ID=MMETSP0038_2-20120614/10698_1 /TAXON_ID=2898 /ORGANISM="Cryptomonas paramecium" /LENGTH=38 /DNA_ID=CAMNT_0000597577 /DNA_START=89 /DNA_END=202 /DNA_ORIENTATION=- /assembly_acc=CAM_ASM_000170
MQTSTPDPYADNPSSTLSKNIHMQTSTPDPYADNPSSR